MREPPKVANLMSKELLVAREGDSVGHAARIIAEAEIRHLPVVDEVGDLVGLLSQRDLLACTDTHGRVRDLTSQDVLTVSGSLPVTRDDGKLVGILTETDFVRLCYRLLGGRAVINDLREEERAD